MPLLMKCSSPFAAPRHPHLRPPPHVCCHGCRAHAWPCLSTGWALDCRFDLTFGTAAVLAQWGGGVLQVSHPCVSCDILPPKAVYRVFCPFFRPKMFSPGDRVWHHPRTFGAHVLTTVVGPSPNGPQFCHMRYIHPGGVTQVDHERAQLSRLDWWLHHPSRFSVYLRGTKGERTVVSLLSFLECVAIGYERSGHTQLYRECPVSHFPLPVRILLPQTDLPPHHLLQLSSLWQLQLMLRQAPGVEWTVVACQPLRPPRPCLTDCAVHR